jgi:DNA-directed RNA polymerase specialized sigma24 family protein
MRNWMSCFCEIGPGLLLFARQWARSAADAEDIVQEAFVKFWRQNRLQRLDDMMGDCRVRVWDLHPAI